MIQRLRSTRPDLQIAYTYFSPSAHALAASLDVDFRELLPFDTREDARTALGAIRPAVLAFSKLDVWPVLTREAAARRVKVALVSATLPATSSRLRGLAPALLRDAYAALDAVGAISEEDAERLVALGVRASVVRITGDTRFDQVWQRASMADRTTPLLAPFSNGRPTIVAGSTWPADERELLPAFTRIRHAMPGLRLVIAPHEPTPEHLLPIEHWAGSSGLTVARLGNADAGDTDVVVVDRVGVLGELYAIADVAFVGGGFHAAGLHSVLEPAAFGVPVLFGPRHANSREARLLVQTGGGASATDARALEPLLERWLRDASSRRTAGVSARTFVECGTGATSRTVAMLDQLLGA